jgi:hypothetical protein
MLLTGRGRVGFDGNAFGSSYPKVPREAPDGNRTPLAFLGRLSSCLPELGPENLFYSVLFWSSCCDICKRTDEAIAQRTKDALAAAKARGQRLGNPELESARPLAVQANKEAADRFFRKAASVAFVASLERYLRAVFQRLAAERGPRSRWLTF